MSRKTRCKIHKQPVGQSIQSSGHPVYQSAGQIQDKDNRTSKFSLPVGENTNTVMSDKDKKGADKSDLAGKRYNYSSFDL